MLEPHYCVTGLPDWLMQFGRLMDVVCYLAGERVCADAESKLTIVCSKPSDGLDASKLGLACGFVSVAGGTTGRLADWSPFETRSNSSGSGSLPGQLFACSALRLSDGRRAGRNGAEEMEIYSRSSLPVDLGVLSAVTAPV